MDLSMICIISIDWLAICELAAFFIRFLFPRKLRNTIPHYGHLVTILKVLKFENPDPSVYTLHGMKMEDSLLENVDRENENDKPSNDNNFLGSSEMQDQEPVFKPDETRKRYFSPALLICISHFLSAWGDRMWAFAVAVLLIVLTPGSLRLTAIYGTLVSLSVVIFGALVGDWIDVTPRLKAARLTLIIQNVAVVACAGVLLVMLVSHLVKGLFYFMAFVLIMLAIVARLSSVGTTIAIERDWVVVIAKDDKALMAGTNAKLRRIDLVCKILAPVGTGLIFSAASNVAGIFFIAGWNVVSLFVEYYLLTTVYKSCPGLAVKTLDTSRHGTIVSNESDENFMSLDLDDNSMDGTVLLPQVKTSRSFKSVVINVVETIKSRLRTLHFGFKLYFQQRVAFAGIGLACLYLTVLGFDSITIGYAYSQHLSPFILGSLMAAGALNGIVGTFLFPKFRRIFGLAKTGVISMSIQLFFLLFCVASVWAPGHPGHLLDPFGSNGDTRTTKTTISPSLSSSTAHDFINGTFSTANSKIKSRINSFIVHPTAVVLPSTINYGYEKSSYFQNSSVLYVQIPSANASFALKTTHSIRVFPSPSILSSLATSTVTNNQGNTSRNDTSGGYHDDSRLSSYISLGLLMTGIVMCRSGLWITDLVITQLFQENIAEKERGIVGGVQNSFNNFMDLAHFVLVTVAPRPEQFGALVLVSFGMVSLGFVFYARFAWNFRKRLLQLEKLSQWSTSRESVEGSSQRLRLDSRSNSQEEIMNGVLTVENENYSS